MKNCPIAKRLGKRAEHLLAQIAAGNDRVFYASENPPGWIELERRMFARHVNSARAAITELGRAYLKAWLP